MKPILSALAANRLNLLLVAAPASWIARSLAPESPWVFLVAAISLVPLAGIIGLGTEELADRSGPAFGGLLNATFGNAAELIIAVVALDQGHIELVKASITGSIIGNLLLVLGASFFVGGTRPHARRSSIAPRPPIPRSMLFLAVVALVMPAVFDLALYGNLEAHPTAHRSPEPVHVVHADGRVHRQPGLRVQLTHAISPHPAKDTEHARPRMTAGAGDRACSPSARSSRPFRRRSWSAP